MADPTVVCDPYYAYIRERNLHNQTQSKLEKLQTRFDDLQRRFDVFYDEHNEQYDDGL